MLTCLPSKGMSKCWVQTTLVFLGGIKIFQLCGVNQYHSARSEKLLLFFPSIVEHRKMGNRMLSVQMVAYCNYPFHFNL